MLPSHLVNVDPLLKAISVDNKAVGMLMVFYYYLSLSKIEFDYVCVCLK